MEGNKLNYIITGFIVILVGVILANSLADTNAQLSELGTVTNDTFTGSNSTCTRITTGCIDAMTSVANNDTVMNATDYSLCRSSISGRQDGLILSTGNALYQAASLNATYTYSSACMYVDNSTSRTLADIIIIFFVLAVATAGIAGVKMTGIFDYM